MLRWGWGWGWSFFSTPPPHLYFYECYKCGINRYLDCDAIDVLDRAFTHIGTIYINILVGQDLISGWNDAVFRLRHIVVFTQTIREWRCSCLFFGKFEVRSGRYEKPRAFCQSVQRMSQSFRECSPTFGRRRSLAEYNMLRICALHRVKYW